MQKSSHPCWLHNLHILSICIYITYLQTDTYHFVHLGGEGVVTKRHLPFCTSRCLIDGGILLYYSLIIVGTSLIIIFDGTAKPIPENSPVAELIAVFIPTTCPSIFNNGPPELPGLIGASV